MSIMSLLRGNAKQAIFIDDEDRGGFLDLLSIVVERFNWLWHEI